MEEILASIRKIIESGDERTSLPGLSIEPRHRRIAAKTHASMVVPDVAADDTQLDSSVRRDLAAEPAPARLFQPANAFFAEAAPFEEPAAWEFVPDAEAGVGAENGSVRDGTSTPVVAARAPAAAVTVSAEASPETSGASRPSLADAYGSPRLPTRSPAAPVEPHVMPPVDVHREAAPRAGSAGLADGEAGVPVSGHAAVPLSVGSDSPRASHVRAETERERPARGELPDFSLEFEEEDFAASLLDEVEGKDVDVEATTTTATPSARETIWLAEPTAIPHAGDNLHEPATAGSASRMSVMAETSSLISAEAGAQVAAAFDDLSRAIRDGHMKSMEQMAREMLRPMLQEWLDDNLPRLVEKLVREEIERVARGGRR